MPTKRSLNCKKCGNHIASKAHKAACKGGAAAPVEDAQPVQPDEAVEVPSKVITKGEEHPEEWQQPPKEQKQLLGHPPFNALEKLEYSLKASSPPLKVHITPKFRGADEGDGGVRRVIEGQYETFEKYGVEIVDTPDEADVILLHILEKEDWLRHYSDKCIVLDNHGLYWSDVPGEWPNWALKANREILEALRQVDSVVAHSEWVAQAIRRHTLRRVEVIPAGIEPEDWQPPRPSKGYVLWNKNRADPVCDPNPVIQLANEMPEQEFITTLVWDNGVPTPPNLSVTGRLPFYQAQDLIKEAGVYLATVRETFGVGTLEALAAGVPVVGWRWGGQAEMEAVIGTEAMLLCDPGDFEATARNIELALAEREARGRAAAEAVKAYDQDLIGERYAEFLRQTFERWQERRVGPRVSVIVTAYNLEKYLPDCLESVIEQTETDWECIIVDDASPDGSGELADVAAFKDKRFRVIHNEENQYLSGARNTAISQARGRYILPLDADDKLAPDALRLLADALDKNRAVAIAYGNVFFTEEDGSTPSEYGREPGHSGWPIPFRYDWQEQQRNLLPYASMFRREVWELTGGYRRRCRTAEDADFWLRAASYGFRPEMVTTQDTLIYRNREGSMSREEGGREWALWFPWYLHPEIRPAGALIDDLPIHSGDPPIVSVIIPVGPGHEELLWDALDSVDAQTFRQWECIVINDTGAPLPRALPSWVRLIEPPISYTLNGGHTWVTVEEGSHGGVARARNAGIAQARGRFFLPLDADDYLQPECLKVLLQAQGQTHNDIVYSDWFQEHGEGVEWDVYEAPDYDAMELIDHGCIHAVTALYARSLWTELGGFDEALPAWEDWDFQLGAAELGRCSTRVAAPLWVYRKYTGYRREENFSDGPGSEGFERSKQGILAKWKPYFDRSKELMACGCSKNSVNGNSEGTAATLQPPQKEEGAVKIQYISRAEGNRTIRGPSGQSYVFGGGSDRIKYVLPADAEYFLNMPGQFQSMEELAEAVSGQPQLIAEGPPAR